MHFAKVKRDKVSVCNICQKRKSMTWDHVPPKGGVDLCKVEMTNLSGLMTSNEAELSLLESQNGLKFRTICKECNDLLGVNYDSTLNYFALTCSRYLKTNIQLPEVIHHKTKPQRLLKSIIGHLLAAKVEMENTHFDVAAREYVLDENAILPDDINIFYWVYPYKFTTVLRDFAMFTPRGTFNKPAIFQALKYFPIAYLCCTELRYANLTSLTDYRNCSINDEIEIPINLKRIEQPLWPEEPCDKDNNITFVGKSAANSIYARPRINPVIIKD